MEKPERMEFESSDGQLKVEMWTGEHDIVFARATGHKSLAAAKQIFAMLNEIRDARGGPFPLCVDMSGMTGSDPEQRKFMQEHALVAGSPIEKFAVVGGNFIQRNLYNMFAKVSSVPMKLFKNEADAVRWLLEDGGAK